MGIVLWIVFGALAGWIASSLMGGVKGLLWDIVIGIAGGMLGGFIMSLLGKSGVSGFNLYSLLVAVLGAVVLLWIVKAFKH